MSADLKEQAQQLIELNEKRTPGEWAERTWADGSNFQGFSNVVCDEQELTLVTETLKEDAAFIAHTANHAPAIAQAYLDKCEEVERFREIESFARALLPQAERYTSEGQGLIETACIYCNGGAYTGVLHTEGCPWEGLRQALGENNDKT